MIEIKCGRGGKYVEWADKHILTDDSFPEDSVYIALVDGEKIRGVTVFTTTVEIQSAFTALARLSAG